MTVKFAKQMLMVFSYVCHLLSFLTPIWISYILLFTGDCEGGCNWFAGGGLIIFGVIGYFGFSIFAYLFKIMKDSL